MTSVSETDIAIVGMAAHLPGAADPMTYWRNLRDGVESIRRLSRDELLAAGEAPHLITRPDYVPAAAPLDGFADFDADFFGFSPKEAAIMDPQHRQFLEVAWEALEQAGHPPEGFGGRIGVYAGCGMGSYFYFNICSNPDLVDQTGMFLLRHTGNDKDFLSTRVSHVFDLKGPSVNVQTACSTSLVATHLAVSALLGGECDMALAGGVTIELPHARGYLVREGEILSPDGHCHAFDHRAQGTVFGSGAGVVVLRRLKDAIADGDHVWAVIKGTAINNDGAAKSGYLAPSVDGQAAAVAEAQAVAGVTADTIGYVECHGTGTYLGDPIEVAALTEAFRRSTDKTGFCRLGSVKTNIGHTDTAAGVAGLIKTALALHHGQIPPSLGYEKPNPAIAFDGSPFVVADRLEDWPATPHPRRAGVNSLGVGGTNAHAVLEQAPARALSEESDWPFQILTLSARSKAALDAQSARLAAHLRAHPDQPLADVAWTLYKGRRAFDRRRVIVAETHEQAATLLEEGDPRRVFTHAALTDPQPTFMFPGGGAQYAGMARDLYDVEPVFRDWMDRGLAILQPMLDYDIRALWLPQPGAEAAADDRLRRPSVQLPLIMITEYALAQLWMAWGVRPTALIGHSMGENTAACLAGVMSFADCIGLIHLRGTLFDTVPPGGMLSVPLGADALRPYLTGELDLASANAPNLSVASGPDAALAELAARLAADGIDSQRIAIDIAAHSRMLEPILSRFGDYLRSIRLNAPAIPIISNRSGTWLTDAQATDPAYWVAHLRNTVNFLDGLTTLSQTPDRIYIEVGPGRALASLAGQHGVITAAQVVNSLRHPADATPDDAYFLVQLGRVWACGGTFDWAQIWGTARRNRVPLPTYAFQRSRYFIEPGRAAAPAAQWLHRVEDVTDWGWAPRWTPAYAACDVDVTGELSDAAPQCWAIFADDAGLATAAADRLRRAGHTVSLVRPGDSFARDGQDYVLAPERGRDSYDLLLRDMAAQGRSPTRIAHLWLVTRDQGHRPGSSFFHRTQEQGFWSLFYLAQALAEQDTAPPHITVVTNGAARVKGEALPWPSKSTVLGPARVIPREFPGVTVSVLDLTLPKKGAPPVDALLEEMLAAPANTVAALRDGRRFERGVKPQPLPATPFAVVDGAPVLITGGFGGIGLTVAEELIRRHRTPVALIGRTPLPPRADWDAHLRRAADLTARRIRAVLRLEAAGGHVLPLTGDVSNVEDMRAAIALAEAEFGPLKGLIHAAGVVDDAPILTKSPLAIEDVFTPKIHGTLVLADLLPDGKLDWMVLFSSTSTATAPAGQADYVAANEFLNHLSQSRAGGRTKLTAVNWGIWTGVGMAAEAMEARVGRKPLPPEPVSRLLISGKAFDGDGHRTFHATWRARDLWVLDDHRTRAGDALLPGTGYLELLAQALAEQGEALPFTLHDLTFLAPLATPDDTPVAVRVTLARNDTGYDVTVDSDAGTGWLRNAEGAVSLMPLPRPPRLDLDAIAARLPAPHAPGVLQSPQETHLAFGPRWRVLTGSALGSGEGLARLHLPPQGAEGTVLHPGVMDLATGWAMGLIEGYTNDRLWVPMSYGAVRVHGALTPQVAAHVRNAGPNRAGDGTASFDVTIAAPDGRVLVEIAGFTIRRLDGAARFAAVPAPRAADGPRPLSPAEERLRHNLTQGIRPEDGAQAFFRALASGLPQITVTSLPLPGLIAEAGEARAPASDEPAFERPSLDNDYAPPEGEIEQRLAGFWTDLLGVAQVGANDSFFDLGGHSLIAVRLFAMVKRSFAVEFPISVLFQAPTIRKVAALIAERGGTVADPGTAPAAATVTPLRRFTHLVPMHQGDGGPRTPFFLVAGMFGNVLNLRHLAHLIGTDRPFYGLQARGLLGDAAPHDDLRQAATDMIAEMVQVHKGPWMVGGFSGGGITALEIAHQLAAAGQEVAAVVMLDTPLPQRRPLTRADRLAIHRLELAAQGPAYPWRWLTGKLRHRLAARRPAPEQAQAAFHDTAIEQAFYRAIAAYPLRPWDGPLTLFRPPLRGKWQVAPGRLISSERALVLPDNDWGGFAPRLEVFEVPGDHDSMVLEPNVRVLAARLRRVIEATERARQQPRREAAE